MAIANAICKSFIDQLLNKEHDLDTDTLKVALYTSSATLDADTTAYSATNEVSSANYTAGGATLTPTLSRSGTTKIIDFADVSWTPVTFTARGALIYNSSAANKAIAVLDFGDDYAVTAGTFQIQWPDNTASQAIIRVIHDG